MKFSLTALLVFAALAAGCRSNANQELLERQLREEEDRIYQLENQLDDSQRQLEAFKRGQGATGNSGGSIDSPRIEVPRAIIAPEQNRVPAMPKIEQGTPVQPDGAPPTSGSSLQAPVRPDSPQAASDVASEVPASDGSVSNASYPAPDTVADIKRISLYSLLTAGHQFGQEPGDNGVTVVFAPRDADDRAAPAEGAVSIVAIDPELSGPAARVARWDFSATDAATHYRESLLAPGYHFELFWPDQPPQHERLKLFVRLTTADGRKFQTDQTINVKLISAASSRWTQSDGSRSWEAPAPAEAQYEPEEKLQSGDVLRPMKKLPSGSAADDGETASGRTTASRGRAEWSPYR